ncbi:hypothetical protein DM860_017549 [Cuscuta australis]|uniref:Uncharacterized protein n=1 Tax=Cuscuta australis TaxID=267555 RepID=A0A328DY28_9ASTE|nr:hypothetical protein DM860_017549 [Cuscuta australis]
MNQFCSSSSSFSSSNSKLHLLQQSRNTRELQFHLHICSRSLYFPSHSLLLPHLRSHKSSIPQPLLLVLEKPEASSSASSPKASSGDQFCNDPISEALRRPAIETSAEEDDEGTSDAQSSDKPSATRTPTEEQSSLASSIDAGLSRFARKMSIFEPGMGESIPAEKLPKVNLHLYLYRAKVLARNFQYTEAENILHKCIYYWPEEGRPYVALGKMLSRQSKVSEAISVYEKGCQATQGENAYIWQSWAVLECRLGNIGRARELFDAAIVADRRHIAAWHGWAILEIKQGNDKKAMDLLGKCLKYSGGNEYIYQTLALLEVRAKRFEQARYLFKKATKCNTNSCASWLAWAQLEAQSENVHEARKLFEKAVQASPKNRFAWHVWGAFEANLGNIDQGRKLLRIGYILNPRDPVLLQSLALIEYKHSSVSVARVLFQRASELDPRHQAVWNAWGWMEWKEGNISTARKLYQKVLSINSTNENAGRCLQAWGHLEQSVGNLSAARKLFISSLKINSQSSVTWMAWANLEEELGNYVLADEIRNLYSQQCTVDDNESMVTGFLHIIDPAIGSLKKILNLGQSSSRNASGTDGNSHGEESHSNGRTLDDAVASSFNLDNFIRKHLSLEPLELTSLFESCLRQDPKKIRSPRRAGEKWDRTSQMPLDH